jgi:uncharacterized protein
MSRAAIATTERRHMPLADSGWQLRAAATDDGTPVFEGYAAKFDQRTAIGNPLTWGFYEEIAPGAFTKTLKEGDPRFLVDHDTRMIVARSSAGDLRLTQDKVGLATEADLDTEVSYVRDLVRNVEKRRITGMSFMFSVVRDDWSTEQVTAKGADGKDITTMVEVCRLLEVRLFEVSAVTFPAYESTEASLRSVASALVRRGDEDAIARHIELKPELSRYTEIGDREPGRSTRGNGDTEPAVSTPLDVVQLDLSMRGYAALYGLELAAH